MGKLKNQYQIWLFGLIGGAILIGLGIWQLNRLAEKEAYLAALERKIEHPPIPLPLHPDEGQDKFLAVKMDAVLLSDEIHILTTDRFRGMGFRVIGLAKKDARNILIDRGYIPQSEKNAPRPGGNVYLEGNLHWPDEVDNFTPPPDLSENIWYARDVPELARALDAEPFLFVVKSSNLTPPTPLPVSSNGIANNHLQYSITWFALAIVWLLMTGYALVRNRQ